MSWLFSQELVEEYSAACCSGGELSAPLSTRPSPPQDSPSDRMMDASSRSPYGTTCGPLTACRGEALLMWFLAASRAKRSAPPLEATTTRKTFGRKCGESWQMSLPGVSMPRTSRKGQSTTPPMTSRRWVTRPSRYPLPRLTWVRTTFGNAIGFLHTPTATGNYCAPSMQKHQCARAFRQVFGSVTPEAHEWLMGWPIGWTASEPLGTGRFLAWLHSHSLNLPHISKEQAA